MNFLSQELNVNNSINQQELIEINWESDFEKNENDFATSLALGIFNQSVNNLSDQISPYNRSISNISFEITKMDHAKKISVLTKDSSLPPFKEWLLEFSEEPKYPGNKNSSNELLRNYINDSMTVIGGRTKAKLNELFLQHTSKIDNKNLQFIVEWHPKRAQQFINITDPRINYLSIELWFDNNKIEDKSLVIIEKNKFNKEDLLSINKLNKIMLVGLVILMGIIYVRCEFFEKTLRLPPYYL